MTKAPLSEWNSKEVIIRRAAYLLIGLAIGMFMLGALQMARQSHLQSLQQATGGAPVHSTGQDQATMPPAPVSK